MNDVERFIAHARQKGMDHGTIRSLLLSAGWKEREISTAIAVEGLDLPVPAPPGGGGARDAFLYLLTFSALYAVVTGVIVIGYEYLDRSFPDSAWSRYYLESGLYAVRWALAAILIAFPLFAWLSRLLRLEIVADPEKQHGAVRRWLTYLTLFAAAAMMTGDLIVLLTCFLDGELTTRFLLKALLIFVIAGVVLGYYLISLRPITDPEKARPMRRGLIVVGLLLIGGAVVQGFFIAGSPLAARTARIDERRVDGLRAIHNVVQQMAIRHENGKRIVEKLPQTLDEVAAYQRTRQYGMELELSDPESGEKYGYRAVGYDEYELCATFTLSREKSHDLFWNHPAGRHCFQIKAASPP